jgi:coiled-coil domain-containing protein 55
MTSLPAYVGLTINISKMSKMKFGLNTSLKKTKLPTSLKPKAFFQGDDDDDDTKLNAQETKDSHKTRINKQLSSYSSTTNKKIEEQHKQALEEDPNIFDYDAVYDDLKTAEQQKKEQLKGKDNKKASCGALLHILTRSNLYLF